jgi:hypothetical protein
VEPYLHKTVFILCVKHRSSALELVASCIGTTFRPTQQTRITLSLEAFLADGTEIRTRTGRQFAANDVGKRRCNEELDYECRA